MRCWGVRRRVDCIAAVRWECARASPRDGPCRSPPSTLRPCLETPSSALILSPCAGSASMEPKDPELSEPEAGMASDPREAPAALSGADVQGLGAGGEPGTERQVPSYVGKGSVLAGVALVAMRRSQAGI